MNQSGAVIMKSLLYLTLMATALTYRNRDGVRADFGVYAVGKSPGQTFTA